MPAGDIHWPVFTWGIMGKDQKSKIICGDALASLQELPDGIVRCCVTSPPYWGLRDYGVDAQLGLERTPEEYTAKMVEVFREVRRVLADDGTLWLNLGDTYAANRSYQVTDNKHINVGNNHGSSVPPGLKPKDLVGIPWTVAFALRADGWYLRHGIIWSKPNPMPESVTDRPTTSHEYVFLLSKAARYFYNAEAIKEPGVWAGQDRNTIDPIPSHMPGDPPPQRGLRIRDKQRGHSRRHAGFNDRWDAMTKEQQCCESRNRRSVWEIATQPFPGAHFAVMPEALVEPCILAGSAPGDLVLDPFSGSGTVGLVALRGLRRFIGIELNPDYCAMAERRLEEYSQQEELFYEG